MDREQVSVKITQQLLLSEQIQNAVLDLEIVGERQITRQRVQVRLDALDEDWHEFSVKHKSIDIALIKLSQQDRSELSAHRYFTERVFQATRNAFLDASETMNTLLERFSSSMRTNTDQASDPPIAAPLVSQQAQILPPCELPKFDGNHTNWLLFKDLFSGIIIANSTLSSIQRLQYLKSCLSGSAAQLIKHTASLTGNFEKVWSDLTAYYDNKCVLIDATLEALISIKPMTKESATELENLYATVNQHIRTLETLGEPVQYWNSILIFLTVRNLDRASQRAWKMEMGSSTEYPSRDRLNKFLTTRIRSLQGAATLTTAKPSQQTRTHNVTTSDESDPSKNWGSKSLCVLCQSEHYLFRCPQYSEKSIQDKIEFIKQENLCFNCLGFHRASSCTSTKRCLKCAKKHHTSIHRAESVNPARKSSHFTQPEVDQSSKQVLHSVSEAQPVFSAVYLATAQIKAVSDNGQSFQARALIDQGSEVSLVSERLVQALSLPRQHSRIAILGVGGQQTGHANGSVHLKFKPHFNPKAEEITVTALVLPRLTSIIPSMEAKSHYWPHLSNLTLADPDFGKPARVDVILGADIYGKLLKGGIKRGDGMGPIAQSTSLGWIVSGPTGPQSPQQTVQGLHCSVEKDLYSLVEKFWSQEETPDSTIQILSPEEEHCENYFRSTVTRSSTGRYIVRLPFRTIPELGDSKLTAIRTLDRLIKRFTTNEKLQEAYTKFLKEYESLGHMQPVPPEEPEPAPVFYLPHHGVIRESSLTTKLRVVFNGSSKTLNGFSLNDFLHTGVKLQNNLMNVLLWFRKYQYVFCSDIEKMYRQIAVHPEDWKYQRILWKDQSDRNQAYNLTTVTYGLACAPFLALRTLNQLVEDEGKKFPLAVSCLTQGRYVDDVFGGADSVEEAQQVAEQVNSLCMAGGLPLAKWASNDPAVLKPIDDSKRLASMDVTIDDQTGIHTLGLTWQPRSDIFRFSFQSETVQSPTKRMILSQVAKLFDPLGFLAPVVIVPKIMLQKLWILKVDWDDKVPKEIAETWIQFLQSLPELSKIEIPRWINDHSNCELQIHGFSDASQVGLAAAVYLRVTNGETVTVSLVCAKTKVTPVKRMTIPRLELSAAALLTRIVAHVIKTLEFSGAPTFLWTDSSIVHTWINQHPSRWKEYVHNRACYIQTTLPQAKWRLVPGTDNPADCASRGITPTQLKDHPLWWSGPPWLSQNPSQWANPAVEQPESELLEERAIQVQTTSTKPAEKCWDLLNKYSSLSRLLKISALCLRFISQCKITAPKPRTPNEKFVVTPEDLEMAKLLWVGQVQQSAFRNELDILSNQQPETSPERQHLPKQHPLAKLTPFIDEKGLLRIRGRLKNSLLPYESKHPLILPRESRLSHLIIADAHERTFHGSTQATLAFTRKAYWIIGGRIPVRSFILKCVTCTIFRQRSAEQLMGNLPTYRVQPSAQPFINTGLDYAGPLTIKAWSGRCNRTCKGYIVLFVCHATSAIHLEIVTNYTSEAFLAAYRRFTSRRGIPKTLSSDCGTNLKGADAELQRLFGQASKELKNLANLIAEDQTKWIFNPPAAPHFGGKWEAGVKSVKYHLKRVIGESLLTYEELSTLLCQIEAILNSRPLCPLTDDPNDLSVLTPGHFIIGKELNMVPSPSLVDIRVNHLSRWQHIQHMMESFWRKWSQECLQRYLAIYKWNQTSEEIKPGVLVLVKDERYPPSKWALGRVVKVHPGKDGLIRVASVRSQDTTLIRPIVKLCPLPITTETV